MAIGAVLFDIDGTLVDSNYLHVEAWSRAFFEVGRPVDAWRVHRSIGMDGDQLLESLLGEDIDGCGPRAKELHTTYYRQSADRLRVLSGARELIRRVHSLGLHVVLATSAPDDELKLLRRTLDIDEMIYAATSSESVDEAKPDPDLIEVALAKAGVDAGNAVMVGDAVWDMKAATWAGVVAVGVRSGGMSTDELEGAGAAAVYDDARDLLDHLDGSVISELVSGLDTGS